MNYDLVLFTPDNFDLEKVDVIDCDVNTADYPDLCDSYIIKAKYDGKEMNPDEIEWVEENYRDWVYEIFYNFIF